MQIFRGGEFISFTLKGRIFENFVIIFLKNQDTAIAGEFFRQKQVN